MGRSSQSKAKENRAQIVQTASRLFREAGVENVSVAQIMTANGMTVGGFYKHFESKDALIEEAFSLAFEQSRETWDEVYNRADEASQDRAATLVRQYLRNSSAKYRCPLLAFAPGVSLPKGGRPGAHEYEEGAKSLLDKFMREKVGGLGDLAQPTDAENEALVIFAAMVGARLLAQSAGQQGWVQAMEAAVTIAAKKR
ncbi:TetR/AcrR family transcriptional regulator [Pseudomonas monteilii]|uniref:TetR/AcrR family transcriptional regulator n=1 Tax=Pseudomonas monteilii TaxID=76759 RepID=A0A399M674_9PSED|nr:TetR/AcrR family transcriptional regulator [Pseudomonas monteilii]RII76799.1 TetR/AcrR family transcriptional regulator [Pseudomonas monteilii]